MANYEANNRRDLFGKTIGELEVIGKAPNQVLASGEERACWEVECSCGTTFEITTKNLMRKRHKCCNVCTYKTKKVNPNRTDKGKFSSY